MMENLKHPSCDTCPHCAGPLSKDLETSRWTISPLIRDSFCMIGSAVGGTASAFYGFNHVMPVVQRRIKGPMWLQFLVGVSVFEFIIFVSLNVISSSFANVSRMSSLLLSFIVHWKLIKKTLIVPISPSKAEGNYKGNSLREKNFFHQFLWVSR
ncbi:hypothetical protein MKW94_026602 [Papaver nudicaule]|uniref:Uncharacterized protein n=1 Tax=Papaver nudicaule TaxID=74823 RepID=A0AA41S5J4_PAPNU|nr:hypothetical protein [Papaver nudicaule]